MMLTVLTGFMVVTSLVAAPPLGVCPAAGASVQDIVDYGSNQPLDRGGLPIAPEKVLVQIPGLTGGSPLLQSMVKAAADRKMRVAATFATQILASEAPTDVKAVAHFVLAIRHERKPNKAATHWEAMRGNPCFHAAAVWHLSLRAERQGKAKDALALLDTVPQWDPRWADGRIRAARLHLRQRKPQRAYDALLGVDVSSLGKAEQIRLWTVLDAVAKAQKDRPLRRYVLRKLWRISSGSARTKAASQLRRLKSSIGTGDHLEIELRRLSTSKRSVRKVLKSTKRWTRRLPGFKAYVRGAALSKLRKRREEAVRHLKVSTWKLKGRLPRARAHYRLGHLLGRLNRESEGLPHLRKVATLAPGSPIHETSLWRLVRMYTYLGRSTEALSTLEELERRFPWSEHGAQGLWSQAWAAYQQNRLDLASDHLTRLMSRYGHSYTGGRQPWAAQALYWMARIEDQQGRKARARQLWAAVVDRWPMGHYAHLARMQLGESFPVGPSVPTEAVEKPTSLLAGLKVSNAPALFLSNLLTRVGWTQRAEAVLAEQFGGQSPAGAGDLLMALAMQNGSMQRARYLIRYRLSHMAPPDRRALEGWRTLFETPYLAEFQAASTESGTPMSLLYAIGFHESRFNPKALSVADAMGIMQVVPSVERIVTKALNLEPQGRQALMEPAYNIRIGAHFLAGLVRLTGGNNLLLTSAYASGNHILRQWLKRTAARDLDVFVETMPYPSVRSYAKGMGVMTVAFSAMHPEWNEAAIVERGYRAPVPDRLPAYEIPSPTAAAPPTEPTPDK
jgi:soluble lytic murein transglycosylase-like protein